MRGMVVWPCWFVCRPSVRWTWLRPWESQVCSALLCSNSSKLVVAKGGAICGQHECKRNSGSCPWWENGARVRRLKREIQLTRRDWCKWLYGYARLKSSSCVNRDVDLIRVGENCHGLQVGPGQPRDRWCLVATSRCANRRTWVCDLLGATCDGLGGSRVRDGPVGTTNGASH